jgi:hypothetical protein
MTWHKVLKRYVLDVPYKQINTVIRKAKDNGNNETEFTFETVKAANQQGHSKPKKINE